MPKVRWALSHGFYSKFHALCRGAKFENRLSFDKVTDNNIKRWELF